MSVLAATLYALSLAAHGTGDVTVPPIYQAVASVQAVPERLLFAIALQESGTTYEGRFVAWPWTLNVAGEPHRYSTRRQACKALNIALANIPPTRIDVGLGQINAGFHGHRVHQPCDLLDHIRNLQLVASILREQYARSGGDWITAAGLYHRPAGGEQAANYRSDIKRHLSRLTSTNVRGVTR